MQVETCTDVSLLWWIHMAPFMGNSKIIPGIS